ncbi:MAG: hypothetical protein ABW202_07040 [Duganella sp.]
MQLQDLSTTTPPVQTGIWYALATVHLSAAMREQRGLLFTPDIDELGDFEYCYVQCADVPVLFQRYQSEPEDIYVIEVDVPLLVKKTGFSPTSFLCQLLAFCHIEATAVKWRNAELDLFYPERAGVAPVVTTVDDNGMRLPLEAAG